ncbi:MAG: DNA-3-methyladenine glycosylase 2 family protein [Paracoccaceae bacterium]|nr:DNA-3-methyladenine glycosylase 2 family protein [Paracoccaceae bacterium]
MAHPADGIGRVIQGDACVAEGADWLAAQHPRWAKALDATGPLPLRLRPDGFAQLLSAIVSQQVSVASARAIWAKLENAGMTTPEAVVSVTEEDLRALGLSRQKASYAHALAAAGIDYDALRAASTPQVIETLTAVKGIGVWTAEIYAMFSLGRADVFAPGDLALQEGARILFDLPDRPREKALRQMAEDWRPWRSVAARTLWAYYHVVKQREGIA